MTMKKLFYAGILLLWLPMFLSAGNGYELWLRYKPLPEQQVQQYAKDISSVRILGNSAVIQAVQAELKLALSGLLKGHEPVFIREGKGALVIGTFSNREIRSLIPASDQLQTGEEGFLIRTIPGKKGLTTVICGKTDAGV